MDPSKLEQPKPWFHFVGCFATRVTVYSQQVRALNLIYELARRDEPPENATVAIIGAGAAGVTAATALALARPDVSIDILETRPHVLELQRGSSSRYLRPHIYDWPDEKSSEDDAGLPILNWTANTAQKVAAKIDAGFKTLIRNNNNVKFLSQHKVKSVQLGASFYDLTVENLTKKQTEIRSYRWMLVCVGFGLERQLSATNHPYWGPSILTAPILTPSEPSIFVSGNGDGGLIDFAMAAFDGLDHATIENLIIGCREIDEAKSTLKEIEDGAKQRHKTGAEPIDLYEEYKEKIFLPNRFVEQIRIKLRKSVRILFHTRDRHLFTLKSSILNRFIVFLIDRAMDQDGRIQMVWGKNLIGDPLNDDQIKMDGMPPFNADYRFLRFGPDREEVRRPFNTLIEDSPVEDIDVPALTPAAKIMFSAAAKRRKKASSSEGPKSSHITAKRLGSLADHTKEEGTYSKQASVRWWIYGLVGLRTTERLFSVGCFRLNQNRKRNIRIDKGTVYRIDPNSGQIIEHRGNWESEPFPAHPDKMKFFYQMYRPTSMRKNERNWPSQYESVMELRRQLRPPLVGDECWEGWFEDLGSRRGVWGHILAERLSGAAGSLEAAYEIMQNNGRTLINTLSKSMWPES